MADFEIAPVLTKQGHWIPIKAPLKHLPIPWGFISLLHGAGLHGDLMLSRLNDSRYKYS